LKGIEKVKVSYKRFRDQFAHSQKIRKWNSMWKFHMEFRFRFFENAMECAN